MTRFAWMEVPAVIPEEQLTRTLGRILGSRLAGKEIS